MNMQEFRYDGSKTLCLKEVPTGADPAAKKKDLVAKTEENMAQCALLQEKLYAAGTEGLVIAIQARDAAGKDSLIKKVFGKLNPAALEVHAFKAPTKEELAHDYLWRLNKRLPARGKIGVFNRSHYEDVLVTRVHRMEKDYAMPERVTGDPDFYQKRCVQLKNWERYLYENGYRVVKLFLNVGRDEQRRRFEDRMLLSEKHWKLSLNDLPERALWDEYDAAYEAAVNSTAVPEAPWYILPADDKWYTRYLVSEILLQTLTDMAPEYPALSPEDREKIPQALRELEAE